MRSLLVGYAIAKDDKLESIAGKSAIILKAFAIWNSCRIRARSHFIRNWQLWSGCAKVEIAVKRDFGATSVPYL